MTATQDSPAAVSPLLLAAQERLLELRQAHRERCARQAAQADPAPTTGAAPPVRPSAAAPAAAITGRATTHASPSPDPHALIATIAALPPHLGWENERFAGHIRGIKNYELRIRKGEGARDALQVAGSNGQVAGCPSQTAADATTTALPTQQLTTPPPSAPQSPHPIRVYPDIALAMLRRKQTAAGRVWLLLRHLDADGRGWVTVDEAITALSADHSPRRICGRRQAANLLQQGEGLYWDRGTRRVPTDTLNQADGRRDVPCLWLRSTPRVAAALGVERLAVAPVAVDITQLTRSIGHVRAHLFASFHSGRQKTDFLSGRPQPRGPIARETMQSLSAACPNSQRAYERRAGVSRRAAFAIGPEAPGRDRQTAVAQETAWQRGRAHFTLTDRRGRFGPPGQTYLAWQLPNEYTGPHRRLGRGRMKRMNRALADLLPNGMTGNSERPAATRPRSKRFFGTAKAAWSAERRRTTPGDLYWRAPGGAWRVWAVTNSQLGIRNLEFGIGDQDGAPRAPSVCKLRVLNS